MEILSISLKIVVNTLLCLVMLLSVSVSLTTNSKALRRDSISFMAVLTCILFLSR